MADKVKLTKAQHECLVACRDWAAPYEVVWHRHKVTGEVISPRGNQGIMTKLLARGLLKYGRANGTYRITPLGLSLIGGGE